MFVTIDVAAPSSRKVPSLSSASTTNRSPSVPDRARPDLVELAADDERRSTSGFDEHRGEHRRRGRLAVRAGHGDGLAASAQIAVRISAAAQHADAARRASSTSGLVAGMAVDIATRSASPRCAASWPIATTHAARAKPIEARASPAGRCRSPGGPSARAPKRSRSCRRRRCPRRGRGRRIGPRSMSATSVFLSTSSRHGARRVAGERGVAAARPISARRRGVARSTGRVPARAVPSVELGVGDEHCSAGVDQGTGVGGLVVARCARQRHEHRRESDDRELGDARRAASTHDEVGRGVDRRHVVFVAHRVVAAGPRRSSAERAARVRRSRPSRARRSRGGSRRRRDRATDRRGRERVVDPARAERAAERHDQDPCRRRPPQPSTARRRARRDRSRVRTSSRTGLPVSTARGKVRARETTPHSPCEPADDRLAARGRRSARRPRSGRATAPQRARRARSRSRRARRRHAGAADRAAVRTRTNARSSPMTAPTLSTREAALDAAAGEQRQREAGVGHEPAFDAAFRADVVDRVGGGDPRRRALGDRQAGQDVPGGSAARDRPPSSGESERARPSSASLTRDVQQDAERAHGDDERRSAERQERQRHARHGHEPERHADVDERLHQRARW